MLVQLVKTEMDTHHLSIRQAARQIGVAHTTLFRVLNSRPVDLSTLNAVCTWLDINMSTLVATEGRGDDAVVAKIAVLLQRNPGLKDVLMQELDALEEGTLSEKDMVEILAFIAFRVQVLSAGEPRL